MNFGPSHDFLDSLGWTLLHFLWQGLIIAALAAAALRLLRRHSANTRYLVGCFTLLLMAAAPVATFYSLNRAEEIPALKFTVRTFDAPDTTVEIPRQTVPPRAAITVAPKPIAHKTTFPELLDASLPWLVAAWSLGVLALTCRLFAGWLFIQKLRRSATLIESWQGKLSQLAARIGVSRPIRLLQSACVEVPAVIGWLRPVILLPASCLIGLTPAQLESILAHELAHIRRHDYLVNLLQNVVETLLFYHPAVWWVSRRIRAEREHCCDDLAVKICGDAAAYARALATLEELRPAPAPFALAAAGAPLLERIRRLAGQPERSAVRPAWPVAGVIALLLLALLAAALRNNPASAQPATEAPHTNQNVNPVASTNLVTSSNINLPAASAAGVGGPTVIVAVDKSGRYYYQNHIASEVDLKFALEDEAKKSSRPLKFVLLASQDIASSVIVRLMDLARGQGINDVVLQTVPGQITNRVDFKDLLGKSGAAVMPGQYTTLVDPATVPPEVRKKLDQQLKAYQDPLRGALTNQNSIQRSNSPPLPQINIKTKWVEIDVSKIGTNTAAWPFNDDESQNLKSLPGTFTFSEFLVVKSTNAADPDQFIYLHNQTNSGPLSILLSDTRYQSTLKKLEQQDGVDILTAPEVTTESGRQCQIQAVDVNNILIGGPVSDRANSPGNFTNQAMPFGPVLDVIPRVSSDRRKIELTITASVTEFVGYEDPATVTNNHGKRMPKGWAIPHMRLRQFTANLAIENAQTMALGSSLVPIAQIAKPKKYVLGLFHSKATTNTINKTLFLLITPTLINNDGTRFVPPPEPARVADLVRDGKLLYEAGKLDEAEAKLKQAVQADPPNPVANEYLRLIRGRRNGTLVPVSTIQTNATNSNSARDAIIAKLNRIHLSSVDYDDLPLAEVAKNLTRATKESDPEKIGVNFLFNRETVPHAFPGAIDPISGLPITVADLGSATIRVRPGLNDISVADLLDVIVKCSGSPIRYSVNDYAVVFSLRDTNEPPPLEVRTFHFDPIVLSRELGIPLPTNAPFASVPPDQMHEAFRKFFAAAGVDFGTHVPGKDGKTFMYGSARFSLLTVRATRDELEKIAVVLPLVPQNSNGNIRPNLRDQTPVNRTNLVYTSKGRQNIMSKLDKIHLDEIHYDGILLGDVINDLSRRVQALDTNHTGINFFISREAPSASVPEGAIDPATGLPVPARTDLEDLDFRTVKVTIDPPLHNVRLADVLDAITKCSATPIKYSILDYAVVFSLRSTNEGPPLEIRSFHVDPNSFREHLENLSGLPRDAFTVTNITTGLSYATTSNSNLDAVQVSIRTFFASVGVDFSTGNPANVSKAFVWNNRKGLLTVRSTASDLDLLAAAIENLNTQPLQINLKVKIVEVIQNDNRALGFNWTLGNFNISNSVFASNTNIPPDLQAPLSILHEALNPPATGTISGILTEPQFQVVQRALNQRDGVTILSTPEVTTISGHETRIQAAYPGTNAPVTDWDTNPAPTLDIVPTVSAGERTLQLNVVATVPVFIGYNDPGKFESNGTGNPTVVSTTPLPHFRLRQVTSDSTIADGQTMVLGGMINMVPEKGSSSSKTNGPAQRKNTMIFITATLTNPDGTPYHTDQQRASFQTNALAPAAFPGSLPAK